VFAKTTKESGETMNHYKHFTLKEREMIKHYIDIGKNQSEIAILLGRSKSSISRELKRNSLNGEYFPCDAQSLYLRRRILCKPKRKLDNPDIYKCVKELFLNHQWSPEQISARLKMENSKYTISHNTIYIGKRLMKYIIQQSCS
jgi:IS30 family transposase